MAVCQDPQSPPDNPARDGDCEKIRAGISTADRHVNVEVEAKCKCIPLPEKL
jgi:hypothetical protein